MVQQVFLTSVHSYQAFHVIWILITAILDLESVSLRFFFFFQFTSLLISLQHQVHPLHYQVRIYSRIDPISMVRLVPSLHLW